MRKTDLEVEEGNRGGGAADLSGGASASGTRPGVMRKVLISTPGSTARETLTPESISTSSGGGGPGASPTTHPPSAVCGGISPPMTPKPEHPRTTSRDGTSIFRLGTTDEYSVMKRDDTKTTASVGLGLPRGSCARAACTACLRARARTAAFETDVTHRKEGPSMPAGINKRQDKPRSRSTANAFPNIALPPSPSYTF